MNWWILANLVLAVHVSLFVLLIFGLVLAAAGWLRRHVKVGFVFWLTLAVTLTSQPLPGCALTDLERWLRWKQDPEWHREMSLLRTVAETLTGAHPPAVLDIVFPTALASLAVYAFARYYLRDLLAAIRRRTKAW